MPEVIIRDLAKVIGVRSYLILSCNFNLAPTISKGWRLCWRSSAEARTSAAGCRA